MKKNSQKNGYTLVEIVIYLAILSVFFIIIVNSILSFTKPYREILALRVIERSGLDVMERVTRDIRSASSVDTANSILGTSPGVLVLNSLHNSVTSTKFYIDSGVLKVDVNGVYQGPLTTGGVSITNLVFYHLSNSVSSAVKIDMTLQITVGSTTKIKKYYSTVILKGN